MAGKLVHFELPAADAARAREFWSGLFGWSFGDPEMAGIEYWMTQTGEEPGRRDLPVAQASERGPIVYFDTDDIDASLEQVRALGGRAEEKLPIPHVGWFAHCSDTEGNDFGLFQSDDIGRRVTALAVGLAVLAGLAGSVQVAVMGRFGSRIGVLEALAFATAVQLAARDGRSCSPSRQGIGGLGGAFSAPKWMWAGGAMGLLVVLTITFAQPRIGATATIGILIAGQLVMGAVIDRYGLFGVDQIAITWPRAVGIGLLGAGAALSLSK